MHASLFIDSVLLACQITMSARTPKTCCLAVISCYFPQTGTALILQSFNHMWWWWWWWWLVALIQCLSKGPSSA